MSLIELKIKSNHLIPTEQTNNQIPLPHETNHLQNFPESEKERRSGDLKRMAPSRDFQQEESHLGPCKN